MHMDRYTYNLRAVKPQPTNQLMCIQTKTYGPIWSLV